MKWIGAHIWYWVTRFRNDVHLEKDTYLESIANQGSGNLASKHLTVDNGTGKVLFRTGAELKADIGSLELGTTSLTALAGNTVTISFAQATAITTNTTSIATLNTITAAMASAVTLNTAKTSFPGFGTTSTTALVGDTALLQIGTTSTTALAGDTALLALGTTSTTALAGDTTTISSGQAAEITANTAKVGITTGVQTISGVKTFSDAIVSSGLTTASNGNILIDPDGTGSITLKSNDIIFEGAGTVTVPSLKLQEAPLLEGNYVGFAPPLSVTANTLWTLPDGDGTNTQALSTNGSGILSWTSYLTAQNPSITGVVSVKPVHAALPGKIAFYENQGTNLVSIQAHSSLAADYSLYLPTSDGSANQVLKTDGSGNLGWATASSGSSTSYWHQMVGGYKTGWNSSSNYYTFYRFWFENWSNSDSSPETISYSDYYAHVFIAPRAGTVTNIKISGVTTGSSYADPFKFCFYKAGSSSNASSVSLTSMFSTSSITPPGNGKTWSHTEDFSSNNTFVEDDRIYVWVKKDSNSGSTGSYWTININGEYS